MVDWPLVLLIVFAVALPGLLLLRFLPYMQVVEARLQGVPSPRWQIYLASVFPLLLFVVFFIGGSTGVVLAATSGFLWSVLAVPLLFYGWAGRSALQLALLYSKRDPTEISRMSQHVQAVGYVSAGLAFLVASIREGWWMALSGILFVWFGAFFYYAAKKAAGGAMTGSNGERCV